MILWRTDGNIRQNHNFYLVTFAASYMSTQTVSQNLIILPARYERADCHIKREDYFLTKGRRVCSEKGDFFQHSKGRSFLTK